MYDDGYYGYESLVNDLDELDRLYAEGEVTELTEEQIEALMDAEDTWADVAELDAAHEAALAYAAEHDNDDPVDALCSYCYGFGHVEDECEILEDDKLYIEDVNRKRAEVFFDIESSEDDEEDMGKSKNRKQRSKAFDRRSRKGKGKGKGQDKQQQQLPGMASQETKTSTAPPKPGTTTPTTKPATTTSTVPAKTYSSSGYTSYTGKDSHFADPYTTYDGSLTFYCTSSRAGGNNRKEGEFVPDWGLYFDWGWKPWWRAEHIAWPDFNLPEAWDIAFEQLTVAIEKANAGLKVEMGCIGAHGRTGTALAAINVILGCSAKEAIKHVREHHCEHAIESNVQEWWVEWVESQVTGKPCREKPERIPRSGTTYGGGGYSYGGTTTTATCTQQSHFDAWLWLPPARDEGPCPAKGASCTWWEKDIEQFYKGKFVTWSNDAYKTTPLTGTQVVKGYRVPTMVYGKGSVAHNHAKADKNDCWCDVCRYLERGHGVFLRPSDAKEGKEWDDMMWDLEMEAKQIVAERKLALIDKLNSDKRLAMLEGKDKEKTIKVATHDGEIIEVNVTDDFEPKPPAETPQKPKHGESRAGYIYLDGQGWVWEGLAKANN